MVCQWRFAISTGRLALAALLLIGGFGPGLLVPPQSSAQDGERLREQTPGLWDAAGRVFELPNPRSSRAETISIAVGEFSDDSSVWATTFGKLIELYMSGYGSVLENDPFIDLSGVDSLTTDPLDPVLFKLFTTGHLEGIGHADLLILRDHRAVVISIRGELYEIDQVLDAIGVHMWEMLGSLPSDELTYSDQSTNSGLWSVLSLPSAMPGEEYEVSDTLPVIFTGVNSNGSKTTPAIDTGKSTVTPEVLEPQIIDRVVTRVTANYSPTPTIDPRQAADPSYGSQQLQVFVSLTGSSFEASPFGGCYGIGQYADIHQGAPVRVKDAAGNVVGQASFSPGHLNNSMWGESCSGFAFIDDVPLGSPSYTVEIGTTIVATTSPPDPHGLWAVRVSF